jgi:hypothetical protein
MNLCIVINGSALDSNTFQKSAILVSEYNQSCLNTIYYKEALNSFLCNFSRCCGQLQAFKKWTRMCWVRISFTTICLFCLVTGRLKDKWKREEDDNSSESPLSKFFREPQLGTSWYNPGGPTPTFQVR